MSLTAGFKRELLKRIQKSQQQTEKLQPTQDDPQTILQNKTQGEDKVRLRKKRIRVYPQLLSNLLTKNPLSSSHVFNFYNIIGINECSIKDPLYGQSFFKTLFYIKSVVSADISSRYVVLQLAEIGREQLGAQYAIERYKSFGDQRFYRLALQIEELARHFAKLNEQGGISLNDEAQTNIQETNLLEQCLEVLNSDLFVCRLSINRVIISKKLLQLLQYDPQQFSLQALKYRCPLDEAISAANYFSVVSGYLENLAMLCGLRNVQTETLQRLSFRDYIYTRRNKKIYCDFSFVMPNPLASCIAVDRIINESKQKFEESEPSAKLHRYHKQVRSEKREVEVATLRRLIKLPLNLLPENKDKLTGYSMNEETQEETFE